MVTRTRSCTTQAQDNRELPRTKLDDGRKKGQGYAHRYPVLRDICGVHLYSAERSSAWASPATNVYLWPVGWVSLGLFNSFVPDKFSYSVMFLAGLDLRGIKFSC